MPHAQFAQAVPLWARLPDDLRGEEKEPSMHPWNPAFRPAKARYPADMPSPLWNGVRLDIFIREISNL
jgi:hypothetical protein